MKGIERIPTLREDSPVNEGRRKFLKGALKAGGALLGGGAMYGAVRRFGKQEAIEQEPLVREIKADKDPEKETAPTVLKTPLEQFKSYGEVRDLKEGLQAVEENHYKKLSETEEGRRDMETATQNIQKLNLNKFAEPFKEREVPKELVYLIPIQETRARNEQSKAGARGFTGIMPKTAEAFGYKPDDVNNPYIAGEVTARFLENEKNKRFGDDIDLLLHAYNAGGGMLGYTRTTNEKADRSSAGFYEYMQEYLNTTYKKVEESGHYEYTVRPKDTLGHIAQRFQVPRNAIEEYNNMKDGAVLRIGSTLRIPFDDLDHFARVVFRKPFETLHYVPQVKAKYRALKDAGFVDEIEVAMGIERGSVGVNTLEKEGAEYE